MRRIGGKITKIIWFIFIKIIMHKLNVTNMIDSVIITRNFNTLEQEYYIYKSFCHT